MNRLTTGNHELDTILHGGLPAGAFVVVGGPPGSGKSVLAHQISFANATADRPVHYYSTMSEPQSKMKRHLQDFTFYDDTKFGQSMRLIHLTEFAERAQHNRGALAAIVEEIVTRTYQTNPSVVVVDSSRALQAYGTTDEVRAATFDLASKMGHSGALLVYVGEYDPSEALSAPEFAVADAIIELRNERARTHDGRSIRIAKLRGSGFIAGQHPVVITTDGLQVHRRMEGHTPIARTAGTGRLAFADDELNAMTGGGIPRGDTTLILGPTGTGKTTLALHWVRANLDNGDTALYLALEESAAELVQRADGFGLDFTSALDGGQLRIVEAMAGLTHPDRIAHDLRHAAEQHRPEIVVVDAISSLLPVLRRAQRSPGYQTALVAMLHELGATTLLTHEIHALGEAAEASEGLSYLANTVILLRYMERGSELGRVLSVLKMRRSDHDKGLLRYAITGEGLKVLGQADGVRQITGWTVLGSPTAA